MLNAIKPLLLLTLALLPSIEAIDSTTALHKRQQAEACQAQNCQKGPCPLSIGAECECRRAQAVRCQQLCGVAIDARYRQPCANKPGGAAIMRMATPVAAIKESVLEPRQKKDNCECLKKDGADGEPSATTPQQYRQEVKACNETCPARPAGILKGYGPGKIAGTSVVAPAGRRRVLI